MLARQYDSTRICLSVSVEPLNVLCEFPVGVIQQCIPDPMLKVQFHTIGGGVHSSIVMPLKCDTNQIMGRFFDTNNIPYHHQPNFKFISGVGSVYRRIAAGYELFKAHSKRSELLSLLILTNAVGVVFPDGRPEIATNKAISDAMLAMQPRRDVPNGRKPKRGPLSQVLELGISCASSSSSKKARAQARRG